MKHPNTRALFDYWNALRAGRIAPYRSEIDPRDIAPLLESTFILEHQGGENVRFRLAGTRLCESFGMELRGMSALSLWQGECRGKVRDLLQRVISEPSIGHLKCTVETRAGSLFDAEFLYLPMRSDFGDVSRILGCGYYMGGRATSLGYCQPVQHWVDHVEHEPIQVEVVDSPAAPRIDPARIAMGRAPDGTMQRPGEQIEIFGTRSHIGTLPTLRSIEGGRTLRSVNTSRDHLKLVK